jgi:transposase-like protein
MQAYQNPHLSNSCVSPSSRPVIAGPDPEQLKRFLVQQGKGSLLPMLEVILSVDGSVNTLMDTMSKATIESLLEFSAEQVAGPKAQGHRDQTDRPVRHHGVQDGIVELADRKLHVKRPRLRKRQGGAGAEVPVPAYEALRHNAQLGQHMFDVLLKGVSTRRYRDVVSQMAESLGISKSALSRQVIEAGEKLLKELAERRFDELEILIIYIDGIQFAGHHILGAIGVDADGYKHVLGICQGAAENTVTVTTLLASMVERGIKPDRRRLFVIDGAKALRAAIDCVYGENNPVQRCRNHKRRNVLGHLPKEQQAQATAALRAAWKLPAEQGIKKLEQLAQWYQKDQPGAAGSIREGLSEMFTIQRLGLPPALCRCLATTNLIDSGHSCVRRATGKVSYWRDGAMALRWAAGAFALAESRFCQILGHEQLWMLKAHLDDSGEVAEQKRTG